MRQSNASGVRNDLLQLITNSLSLQYGASGILPIDLAKAVQTGPAGETSIGSYTVPANKIAIISSISLSHFRYIAYTAVGIDSTYVKITPNGGGAVQVAHLRTVMAAAGLRDGISNNCHYILEVGDKVEIFTAGTATGGNVTHTCNVSCEEFDAP